MKKYPAAWFSADLLVKKFQVRFQIYSEILVSFVHVLSWVHFGVDFCTLLTKGDVIQLFQCYIG
jgi:hypothetical protein